MHCVIGYFDCPDRALNADELFRRSDLLVTEQLCPGSIGRIGEIVRGTLARTVPARLRLVCRFPYERQSRRRMAIENHVAGEPLSAAARARTFCGPASAGFQCPGRSCAAARPPS